MPSKTAVPGPAMVPATIQWQDCGPPRSVSYDDVYFSNAGGYQESEHVFVAGNQLSQRFRTLPPQSVFTIAETGFGCGLNFLVAWQAWDKYAPDDATLHFISVENAPLCKADLTRSHLPWPHLTPKAKALQNQYPELVEGVHRCVLSGAFSSAMESQGGLIKAPTSGQNSAPQQPATTSGSVRLTLFFGEAADWLQSTRFCADAWFLDGFSPGKNPEIWSSAVLCSLGRHSAPGTTLATYTVAGELRRELARQGFAVSKAPGFGRKRFMTIATCLPAQTSVSLPSQPSALIAVRGSSRKDSEPAPDLACCSVSNPARVLVVGAGLAGALLASNLANRGYLVDVLEASGQAAAGASGNCQGTLYVKLAVDMNPHTRYHLASYLFALQAYQRWLAPELQLWNATGVLQLSQTAREQLRQANFLSRTRYPGSIVYPVSKEQAEQLTGVVLAGGGLFFPQGGWCQPARICQTLLQHPLITVHTNAAVLEQQTVAGGVTLSTRNGIRYRGDFVVYCTGQLPAVSGLVIETALSSRVKAIKGQISQFTLPAGRTLPLQTVICGDGYAMPALTCADQQTQQKQQVVVTGSTFHPLSGDSQTTHEDNLANLHRLGAISPTLREFAESCAADQNISGRASVRAALTDYFPAVGLRQPLTYFNLGYGSKGLALAPLAGEIIADMISQSPLPLTDDLINRLSPLRFANKS